MFCSVQGSQMVPVSPGDGGPQDQAPGPRGTSCLRPAGPPVAPAQCHKKRLGDGPVGITQPLSLHPGPRPSPGCLTAEPRSPGAQEPRAWEEGEAGLSPAGSLCLFYKKFI